MDFDALATDFDGTIAHDGHVDDDTLAALRRARDGGLKLVLVTGRELADLSNTFAHVNMFERVVAENGAVLLNPGHHDPHQRILSQNMGPGQDRRGAWHSAQTPGLGLPRERQPGGPLTAPWVGYGGNPAGGRRGRYEAALPLGSHGASTNRQNESVTHWPVLSMSLPRCYRWIANAGDGRATAG